MESISIPFQPISTDIWHFSSFLLPPLSQFTIDCPSFLDRFNAGVPDIWNKTRRNVKSVAGTRTYWYTYRKTIRDRRWKPSGASCTADSRLDESRGEKYHRLWESDIRRANARARKTIFVLLCPLAISPACFIKPAPPASSSNYRVARNTPILTGPFEFRVERGWKFWPFPLPLRARCMFNFHSWPSHAQWRAPARREVRSKRFCFQSKAPRDFFEVNNKPLAGSTFPLAGKTKHGGRGGRFWTRKKKKSCRKYFYRRSLILPGWNDRTVLFNAGRILPPSPLLPCSRGKKNTGDKPATGSIRASKNIVVRYYSSRCVKKCTNVFFVFSFVRHILQSVILQ